MKQTTEIPRSNLIFGTKAQTLELLSPLVKSAEIGELYYFSVSDWERNRTSILQKIQDRFKSRRYLAIRSSALGEDGGGRSMAGVFHSCLNVDILDLKNVTDAINKVIASYAGNPLDQVLVQPMVGDVAVSGVIMTRNLEDGSPYYVINYDDNSGKTDSVTGGTGVHKTVFISHKHRDEYIESSRIKKLIALTRKLERIYGAIPLDIEFGMGHDEKLYLFQVRPISMHKRWHIDIEKRVNRILPTVEAFVMERSTLRDGIYGRRTTLATMPDWNPAEMIGTTPRPLAASLYRELIMRDVWRTARERMGYRRLPPEELMVMIAGRPYVDVRNSFNSFLPSGLDNLVSTKLVEGWLERLGQNPELHDKVEFEVAHTCIDFSFDENFSSRYPSLLSPDEKRRFKELLTQLTRRCLDLSPRGTLAKALAAIDRLVLLQQKRKDVDIAQTSSAGVVRYVVDLLEECKKFGTLPFAIIARHAFIAESLLRGAAKRGAISEERVKDFKRSIRTITGEFASDIRAVCSGHMDHRTFMQRYGHLRPGTYDITSLRYADREDILNNCIVTDDSSHVVVFTLTEKEELAINSLIDETKLAGVEAQDIFEYSRRAIIGREYAKFVFTRNISDVLESLVQWGRFFNLDREDVSFLDLQIILNTLTNPLTNDFAHYFSELVKKGKYSVTLAREFKLSHIIRGLSDVYVVPLHRSAPNFIGSKKIEGSIAFLDVSTTANTELYGKIVCIENADPGFDWIFTRGIKGLVTKYGGANSHMAIRCAELGLPAAIGCGEEPFERIVKSGTVLLNCADKILKPLYHE